MEKAIDGCVIIGCNGCHHGRGYCKKHYNKFIIVPNPNKCSIENCSNIIGKNGARGFCNKHYTLLKRNGDPLVLKKFREYPIFDQIKEQFPNTFLEFEIKDRSHWGRVCKQYYGDKCSECGWNETSCDVDHIIPHSKGGKNTLSNGRVLCPNCHAKKHRKLRNV